MNSRKDFEAASVAVHLLRADLCEASGRLRGAAVPSFFLFLEYGVRWYESGVADLNWLPLAGMVASAGFLAYAKFQEVARSKTYQKSFEHWLEVAPSEPRRRKTAPR